MRHLSTSLILSAAFLTLGLVVATKPSFAGDGPNKMLTILTSAEPETQAMALVLSNQAAKRGAQVHVLLCGPGGDIALKTPPAATKAAITPKGMSIQDLLSALLKKGGTVDVCALYLPKRKLTTAALRDQVNAAKPPVIAAEMLRADTRVVGF